ncbi:NodT family efflux transporter outer membrane factor (OMF) lipoprotein [Duganella sp. 1411]|uniref:efflux transporter outer membrane subunit n=1 Tax=Duganella sp. 1411 TaxID=2806572 RepID=UPI001AE954D0|nr:TolC family protein [Duganella sp. 1411]MBP1205044.1 NodT family efflux transporter outer membrane factor (OMF) lipoprotein [Duganella sp. 1411]
MKHLKQMKQLKQITHTTAPAPGARRAAPLLALLMGLAGCAVGTPTAQRAPEAVPAALPSAAGAAGAAGLRAGPPPALWWQELGDAGLGQLVQRAWRDNYDVRIATARLAAAGEFARAARGARLPSLDLDASAGRSRLAAIETSDGQARVASPVQWAAVFNWELDLFGRVRHSVAAADASAAESAAVRDDVRRLIVAQVVDAYLELRGAQQLRASLREQLANQEGTLRLVRERVDAGRAAPAERMRAEAQMRLAGARLPSLEAEERVARNRLASLTGQRLDAPELLALDRPLPLALPTTLLTDEPAHLLLRRPDVRAAEQALAAASAREGAAIADRFPRISLGALFGAAGVAGDWNGGDAARWHAGAALSLPLFDGGTRRARARAAGAEVLAAQAGFDKALALALEDADNAISRWVQLRARHAELRTAHQLAQDSARLARVRYQEGGESLLGVLEAERIALAAEEQLVTAHRDVAIATARGYTAMAGGFDADAPALRQ